MSVQEYEFSSSENITISQLASSLKAFSAPLFGLAIVSLLGSVYFKLMTVSPWGGAVSLLLGLVTLTALATGTLAVTAGNDLVQIVKTEGSDITHLMKFFSRVQRMLMLSLPPVLAFLCLNLALLLTSFVQI